MKEVWDSVAQTMWSVLVVVLPADLVHFSQQLWIWRQLTEEMKVVCCKVTLVPNCRNLYENLLILLITPVLAIVIFSFPQHERNPVIIACTSIRTLQRSTANSYFGKILMMPICQNLCKYWLKWEGHLESADLWQGHYSFFLRYANLHEQTSWSVSLLTILLKCKKVSFISLAK